MRVPQGCSITESTVDGRRCLSLSGVIDEMSDIAAIAELTTAATIDLSGVRRINSFGVRSWIFAVGSIPRSVDIRFVRCPPLIIDQANLVQNFFGHGVVESFYAPVICPDCDKPARILVETEKFRVDRKLPAQRCKDCDGALELDDWEERYFAFLEHDDVAL